MADRIHQLFGFIRFLIRRFVANHGLPNAAALTFTSLLSLVPLMTVSLAVGSAFPVSDKISYEVQRFLFENFVPASGEVIQQHLEQFISKASSLTGTGFLFLLLIALMLMANIERALNTIWAVNQNRSPLKRFTMYWAVLTLGPVLVGVSLAVSSYLVALPVFSDMAGGLEPVSRLLLLTPFLASVTAFSLLYLLVPNCSVSWRLALAGGIVSALLFELAKRGFVLYLTQFPTYETIYGGLSTLPIFLLWVYLSWAIVLLGAEFTYCLQHYRPATKSLDSDAYRLAVLIRVLRQLAMAQHRGESRTSRSLHQALPAISLIHIEAALSQLQQAAVVTHTEDSEWVLLWDLDDLQVGHLLELVDMSVADVRELLEYPDASVQAVAQLLEEARCQYHKNLDQPLSRLLD